MTLDAKVVVSEGAPGWQGLRGALGVSSVSVLGCCGILAQPFWDHEWVLLPKFSGRKVTVALKPGKCFIGTLVFLSVAVSSVCLSIYLSIIYL